MYNPGFLHTLSHAHPLHAKNALIQLKIAATLSRRKSALPKQASKAKRRESMTRTPLRRSSHLAL